MFNSIYFNGNEYKEMWLNGNKIWEKDSGGGEEIVYPYADADCVVTFRNTSSSSVSKTFTVIDSSLPYSINGVTTTSFKFPKGETQVKFVNLKPCSYAITSSTFFPVKFEQLRLPNLTNLDGIFARFCYNSSYTYSWSPQYFEFSDNVTNMNRMFHYCRYLTDDMMAQLMPYFPNTSQVTTMNNMFYYCISLTTLNLPFDTSKVTDMQYMFYSCAKLSSINLSFDTRKVTTMNYMFAYCESLVNATLSFNVSSLTNISSLFKYCYALSSVDLSSWNTSSINSYVSTFESVIGATVHVGDGWTLGTESTFGSGTNLVFMRNGESIDIRGDIVLSKTSITCFESSSFGDLNGLGVKLSQCPTNTQTVTYTYTSDRVATWSNIFTFDSTNWDTYQYVYFTPALDGLYTDRTDTITFTSDGVESKVCSVKVYNTERENTGGGDSGDFPYSDADSVITYRNANPSATSKTFTVIDSSLPYSINGTSTTSFSFPANSETQVKLVNLKPTTSTGSTFFPTKIEQLRLPNLTDLSYLFAYFGYNRGYDCSWSPEYFEFNENPINMASMFYNCRYLSQQQMAQFMEHFKTFNTSQISNMSYMFYYNYMITELDLSSFDTTNVWSYSYMFYQVANATIYIGDKWTLGTESTFGNGTGLTFVKRSSGGDSGSGDTGGTTTDSLLVDWTKSTAPTLPSYMTEYYSGTYGWSHGTFTTGVYGLKSDNFSMDGTTAYTCYKYVAPKSGYLNITYRCYAETNYDFMTVHVNTSTSQPSTTSSTNRVLTTQNVSSYQNTDGLATVQVTGGTTYYIHIQYRKDGSDMQGADRGCIRKIELVE